MDLTEYQLIRPSGTVLYSAVAPYGHSVAWEPELGMDIEGECLLRHRQLPDGDWQPTGRYPDGYPGPFVATALRPF